MNYLLIALLLGFLVLIHELGHLVAAWIVGIPVAKFSIGFGPRLCGWKWGKTEYVLAPVPLGGYVLPAIPDEANFQRVSLARRVLFALGGPLANLLLPVAVFALLNTADDGLSLYGLLVQPWVQTVSLLGAFLASFPRP